MKRNPIVLVALVVALVVATTPAMAFESKATKEDKPGAEDYNAGVKLMKKGKYAESQAKFEAALAENAELAEAHNNLAFSLRKQGEQNWKKALQHYNQAIELKPELAEAYMYRGVLYNLMGDEEKALADHAKLLKLDRKLADALQAAIASGEEPEGLEGLAKSW